MGFGEKYSKCYSPEEFSNYIKLSNSEINSNEVDISKSTKSIIKEINNDFNEIRKFHKKSDV